MVHHHHPATASDLDDRDPFAADDDDLDVGEEQAQEADRGGRREPPPDMLLGSEILHADTAGTPRWLKRIYDPAPAALEVSAAEFDDRLGDDKLRPRNKALGQMARDPALGWRPMIMANDAMIADLEAHCAGAPNFRGFFALVVAAARASLHAAMPMRLPPILLVGPPGAGKSRAAHLVAGALGTNAEKVPVTMQTGAGVLSGLDWTWRSPSMGAVARALLGAKTASPILVIDEIDKSCPRSEYGQLLDPLHDLLEFDTAREFRDEYLKLPMAADAILWIATANDLATIPAPILDRMLVLEVQQPNPQEMEVILRAMIQAATKRWSDWFEAGAKVDLGTISALRAIHPRAARRIIDLAVQHAVAAGRRAIIADDVERARMTVTTPHKSTKIGFL